MRTRLRTYIYNYTQLDPGLVPDPAVPPRRAGSSPIASSVPAPIGVPPARLGHQPGCACLVRCPTGRDQLDPPLRESSRQINELRVVRLFVCANCERVYRYTIDRAYARAYTCICACSCIRVSLRLLTCINANAVSYVRLRACLRAELIKTQNTFARKIFQHANALWVQKLSGCTICYMWPSMNRPHASLTSREFISRQKIGKRALLCT